MMKVIFVLGVLLTKLKDHVCLTNDEKSLMFLCVTKMHSNDNIYIKKFCYKCNHCMYAQLIIVTYGSIAFPYFHNIKLLHCAFCMIYILFVQIMTEV